MSYSPVPVGIVRCFAGSTSPSGWLICDGSAISRTTYAALFGAIGTMYGIGDGSTTFNLPDLRQRFPLGKAASGTGATLGTTGGSIDHVHAGGSHTHTVQAHSHVSPSHVHGVTSIVMGVSTANSPIGDTNPDAPDSVPNTAHVHPLSGTTDTYAGGATSSNTATTDSGTSGSVNTGPANPPFLVLHYIIKT